MRINEKQFENILKMALEETEVMNDAEGFSIRSVESFETTGMLCGNRGLVVEVCNEDDESSMFQIQIVRTD